MSSSNLPSPSDSGAAGRPLDLLPFDHFGPEEYELTPEEADLEDGDHSDDGWRTRLRSETAWVLVRFAWIGLAAALSLGSAGIVAATGQSPASGGRPELTYGADQVLSGRLDAGVQDLAQLNSEVIVLGQMARNVLSDLSQVNEVGLSADYQDGNTAVQNIDSGAAALSTRLECKPWPTTRDAELTRTYSQALIDRWHAVCAALESVAPLADDWSAMENGAGVAMEVANDINAHDQSIKGALQSATVGRYPDALTQLAAAAASVADAQRIATELAKVGDVSTLTEWLTRTKTFDDALGLLWQAMIDSKGRVTIQVTAALKAESDAQALLPDNNSILQVVLYELAGDLTSDGLAIETAKGQLATALSDLTGGMVVGQ
jgi:hypothetical protein